MDGGEEGGDGSLNNRDFGLISDYGNTIALNWGTGRGEAGRL